MSTEEPAPVGSQHPRLVRPDGAAPRVLVVDDEQSLAEVLGSVLRREGWTARTAYTGLDAVRIAREFVPDAVILDVMLPDLDATPASRPAGTTT
jgi:two-component system OmpR family response regulator